LNDLNWDSDAGSLGFLPFGGTLVKTKYDGTTWTDTSGIVYPFGLLLDVTGEFVPAGGLLHQRAMDAIGQRYFPDEMTGGMGA
jgi:hypothetical protein